MSIPKFLDLKQAQKKAKSLSRLKQTLVYIIESREFKNNGNPVVVFYVDLVNECMKWESIVGTFDKGIELISETV